jgi:hypothetical protein
MVGPVTSGIAGGGVFGLWQAESTQQVNASPVDDVGAPAAWSFPWSFHFQVEAVPPRIHT